MCNFINMPTVDGATNVSYLLGVIESSIPDHDVRERCIDTIKEIAEYAVREETVESL